MPAYLDQAAFTCLNHWIINWILYKSVVFFAWKHTPYCRNFLWSAIL